MLMDSLASRSIPVIVPPEPCSFSVSGESWGLLPLGPETSALWASSGEPFLHGVDLLRATAAGFRN